MSEVGERVSGAREGDEEKRQWGGRATIRRMRRASSSGTRGANGGRAEAGITVLCPLSPPLGLLVVAGDSDGRLGLWTTSTSSSAHR